MNTKKELDPQRIQFLNDGVFAVAITILILHLQVPGHLNHSDLGQFIANDLIFQLLAILLSFIILGAFWIDCHFHHHHIYKTNKASIWLNLFFLLFICLIPFSTDFVARYHHDQFSVVVYCLNLIGATLGHFFMLLHSWRKGYILSHISSTIYKNMKWRIGIPIFVYSGIIILSLFFFRSWIFYFIPAPLVFQIIFGRGKKEIQQ